MWHMDIKKFLKYEKRKKNVLILYLFHEDYIQPEATSSSPQFNLILYLFHEEDFVIAL
jgi:hypothetical protein